MSLHQLAFFVHTTRYGKEWGLPIHLVLGLCRSATGSDHSPELQTAVRLVNQLLDATPHAPPRDTRRTIRFVYVSTELGSNFLKSRCRLTIRL